MSKLLLEEQAAPSTPAADKVAIYAKADGLIYSKDDAGTETVLGNIPIATDVIWDAAGDLVVGTGADTAHRLAAGATTEILVGGGAADPVWTTAEGTGAPVRAGSPSLTTPNIGAATLGGTLSCADNLVLRPIIKDYAEEPQTAASSATTSLDVEDGNVISFTLTEATTVSTANTLADKAGSCTLVITAAAGSEYAITWPATWKWLTKAAPATFAVSTEHIVTLMWTDGDNTAKFYASYVGEYGVPA